MSSTKSTFNERESGEQYDSRYVLCRPLGGLNDMLCQIEVCWKYAERFRRTLIIDLQDRLLPAAIFSKLTPTVASIPVIIGPSKALVKSLNNLSTRPAQLQGRLDRYKAVSGGPGFGSAFFDFQTGVELGFNLSIDHPEEVLIHHREGGGTQSHFAISRFTVRKDAALAISRLLPALPPNYDAAHLRATDYSSDYQDFFRRLGRRRGRTALLVCSDNNDVLEYAKQVLPSKPVITFPHFLQAAGTPLHTDNGQLTPRSADDAATRLLAEMFSLSRAQNLYITFVTPSRRRNRPFFSGFSTLISFLGRERAWLSLWSNMPPEVNPPQGAGKVIITAPFWRKVAYRARNTKFQAMRFAKRLFIRVLRTKLRSGT